MAKKLEWLDSNQIKIDTPKRTKKITGTRLGAILGLNHYASPFQAWCEITHVWADEFTDSVYTIAGRLYEPMQGEYLKNEQFYTGIVTPEDVYGKNPFLKTYGDFYKKEKIFGGMWDLLDIDLKTKQVKGVFELKTASHPEQWVDGKVPPYYLVQVCLYGFLSGVDTVYLVPTFLLDNSYDLVQKFINDNQDNFENKTDLSTWSGYDQLKKDLPPVNEKNTEIREFKISNQLFEVNGELLDIKGVIAYATKWYETYVNGGISPQFNEDDKWGDAKILKDLRKITVNPSDDASSILSEYDSLVHDVELGESLLKTKKDKIKVLGEKVNSILKESLNDGSEKTAVKCHYYEFTLSKSTRETIDKDKLKEDGLYNKYLIENEVYTIRKKANKEAK